MTLLTRLGMSLVCGFIVMVVHEVPKGFVAQYLTHPIYREKNKMNKNILKYIDPIGLLMFAFLNVGWQLPYDYNSSHFRDKSKGILAVALTGILSNLMLMTLLLPLVQLSTNLYYQSFIGMLIYFNFAITIINLLPVPPFEMMNIIHVFSDNIYFRLVQNERILHMIFILLLIVGIIPMLIDVLFRTSIMLFI